MNMRRTGTFEEFVKGEISILVPSSTRNARTADTMDLYGKCAGSLITRMNKGELA